MQGFRPEVSSSAIPALRSGGGDYLYPLPPEGRLITDAGLPLLPSANLNLPNSKFAFFLTSV